MPGGEYQQPEPGEAADHTSLPSDELNAVNQRMDVLWKEQNEQGSGYPPEWYFLNTKRRILQGIGERGTATAETVEAELVRTVQETEDSGNESAYRAMKAIRWAFLVHAAPHDPALLEGLNLDGTVEQYNRMQQETVEQTGRPVKGFTLDQEQLQTLAWMLDHAAIPHKPLEKETPISLAPLEEHLRAAAAADARDHPSDTADSFPLIDHEGKARANGLIEQWEQEENQEG